MQRQGARSSSTIRIVFASATRSNKGMFYGSTPETKYSTGVLESCQDSVLGLVGAQRHWYRGDEWPIVCARPDLIRSVTGSCRAHTHARPT